MMIFYPFFCLSIVLNTYWKETFPFVDISMYAQAHYLIVVLLRLRIGWILFSALGSCSTVKGKEANFLLQCYHHYQKNDSSKELPYFVKQALERYAEEGRWSEKICKAAITRHTNIRVFSQNTLNLHNEKWTQEGEQTMITRGMVEKHEKSEGE